MDFGEVVIMVKKISVVMTYHNRLQALGKTLETIALSSMKNDIEVIIMDDASREEQKADKLVKGHDLDINYTYINKKDKWWVNPCHVFNLGFSKTTGEIIIIQDAECFHVGDLVGHAFINTKENYLVYSCKNIKKPETDQVAKISPNSSEFLQHTNGLQKQSHGWYNHPKYNPRKYHFTASILKKNLTALGGFDERYAPGYCFDDDEFLARVERSPFPLVMVPPNEVFSVHQWHESSLPKLGSQDPLWKRNHNLFKNTTLKETQWKVN